MDRRDESRGRSRALLIAAALAAALLVAPPAFAAGPAVDEYTLEIPSAGDAYSGRSGPVGSPDVSSSAVRTAGVAGENEPARSPLGAALSTIAAAPVLAVLALLATTWLLLNGPGRRDPSLE